MLNRIVNFILFNALWPVCVIGAAHGLAWPGLLLVAVFLAWQWHPRNRQAGDIGLVIVALSVGMFLDTLWVQMGLLSFASPGPWTSLAPIWIAALWIGFALALNHSLAWIKPRPWLAGAAFIVLSPFSYAVAARLGAVEWTAPAWQVIAATGLSWFLLIPYLLKLAKRWQAGAAPRGWTSQELA